MRSYPIWNQVTACNYKSSKSWGSKDTMTLTQFVGSGAKNSHQFAEIVTTRRLIPHRNEFLFRLYVDQRCIKSASFTVKDGRPYKLIDIKWHVGASDSA